MKSLFKLGHQHCVRHTQFWDDQKHYLPTRAFPLKKKAVLDVLIMCSA